MPRGLTLSCLSVASAGVVALGWGYNRSAFWAADARRETAREARDVTADLVAAVTDAETGQRGFLLTGRPVYLDPYHVGMAAAPQKAQRLRELAADRPDLLALVKELDRELDAKLAELAETVERTGAGDKAGAYTVVNSDRGKRSMERIRRGCRELVGGFDLDAAAARRQQLAAAEATRLHLLIGGTLAVGLAIAAAVANAREARRLREQIRRLVGGRSD